MAAESTKPKTLDEGGKNIVALMTALLVAIFAFQLNASMLSPALVAMQNELNTTATEIGNTQTVFFTAAALFSLFLPRLADIVGRKKVLSGMLLITAIGCIVSAAAQDVTMLMVGRIMQGVAGPVVPMCLIMLHTQVTEEARYTKLMAILTSVNGGIAGVDAILGGWLAGNFGFRSVFICWPSLPCSPWCSCGSARRKARPKARRKWTGPAWLRSASRFFPPTWPSTRFRSWLKPTS